MPLPHLLLGEHVVRVSNLRRSSACVEARSPFLSQAPCGASGRPNLEDLLVNSLSLDFGSEAAFRGMGKVLRCAS